MTRQLVKDYYSGTVRQEWRRLVKDPYHRLEFDTTLHYLAKYLPPTGLILDAGGGPGRYTLELARRGYRVVLLDVVPGNLAFARRQVKRAKLTSHVPDLVEGSITDLYLFEEDTFDAVLCTGGPLSHLIEAGERQQAISELVRVAKPGAPIFVSVMSRLSVMIVVLTEFQQEIELPHFLQVRDTGDYLGGHGFTATHFFLPEEFLVAFEPHPVQILELAGLEGIGAHHRRQLFAACAPLGATPPGAKNWPFSIGPQTYAVALGDLDGDGVPDALVAGEKRAAIWWNDVPRAFARPYQRFHYFKCHALGSETSTGMATRPSLSPKDHGFGEIGINSRSSTWSMLYYLLIEIGLTLAPPN